MPSKFKIKMTLQAIGLYIWQFTLKSLLFEGHPVEVIMLSLLIVLHLKQFWKIFDWFDVFLVLSSSYPDSPLECVSSTGLGLGRLSHNIWREIHENDLGQTTQKHFLHRPRHLRPSQTPEVNIKSDHGHGAGEWHQTDGDSVVHCWQMNDSIIALYSFR